MTGADTPVMTVQPRWVDELTHETDALGWAQALEEDS